MHEALTPRPTGKTAVVIVPPRDICGFVDHYRQLYMSEKMHRIEPHITLVYPFVPHHELEGAVLRLGQVLAGCSPRALALRGFDTFPEEGILYLYLAHPERATELYEAILAEFPNYPAYEGRYGQNIVPHMTVGEFTEREELERVRQELSTQHLFMAWDMESVLVKYESEDDRWHTWAEVFMGGA